MSLTPDRAEAHARDLARFQAIAMHAAEKAHEAIEATQDPAELATLIGALSKAGRVLRMSIALEARLGRDQAREAREAQAHEQAARQRAVETRKAQVRHAVDPLIWTEHEYDDAEFASALFEERLDHEALYPSFADEPVAAQVERIRGILGLTGQGTQRYYPKALRHLLDYTEERLAPYLEGIEQDRADAASWDTS